MAKKLPSKPKAPKAKASLATWENYERKVAEWKKKCHMIKSDEEKKKRIIEKVRSGKVSAPTHRRRKSAVSGAKRKTAKRKTAKRR